MQSLALFDFDGTITVKDSLIKFIRFAVGDRRFMLGMVLLSPMFVAYKLKLIPNDQAKAWMLSHFFKGMREEKFIGLAKRYSLEQIDPIVRPKAMERIAWHKTQGHKVVVVSASMECWLKPWCDKNSIEVIATKLAFKEGVFTGKFLTENCYGEEKAKRIRQVFDLDAYHTIYAYGDSQGDRELLELADEKHYKPFG